jgi:hypothetical protein
LLPISNRWKGDQPGFSNAANGKLRGKYRMKRNVLNHDQEAGRTVEIADHSSRDMGKGNHRATTSQNHKAMMPKNHRAMTTLELKVQMI